jgi:hypothetical protein
MATREISERDALRSARAMVNTACPNAIADRGYGCTSWEVLRHLPLSYKLSLLREMISDKSAAHRERKENE